MKSKTIRNYFERSDESRKRALEFDGAVAEMEKLTPGMYQMIRFNETEVSFEVTDISLEDAYDLCGTVKSILESSLNINNIRWERVDFPTYKNVDFLTRPNNFLIRISTVPSDCTFVVDHYEKRPIYKMECGGANES